MLGADEMEVLEAARRVIALRHRIGWHSIGAAVQTRGGGVHAAVHLEANVGRVAVCAEAVAIGMAVAAEGDVEIQLVAAVRAGGAGSGRFDDVVSPCGMCREMIADYGSVARVVVPIAEGGTIVGARAVAISELLPMKFRRGLPG